ncbi:uncharacterized protein LOC135955090 [Calliphora vicina]|uniref:uncharacterized protein LOC135955090 n=1 Tax=Calliphora vicina TaxID=7373 RepID=UPI00325C09C0
MSQPTTKFDSKSAENPLEDDEFSELTKQEICYWSHKLQITPSQLFCLTKDELEVIIKSALCSEKNKEESQEYYERWEQLSNMKRKLMKKQQKDRLKGGGGPDLLDILARAAKEIEYMYGSRCGNLEKSGEMTYNSSFDTTDESPFSYSLYSDEEAEYESTAEDYSFNIDQNLASTPYNACPKRQLPLNNTYSAPNPEATYNCPNSSFKLSDVTPPAGMRSGKYSSYNLADISPPSGMQLDIDNISGVTQTPSFRNYTDYSIQYSPIGTEETANSISVENYDETSGKVTASSRTFTLPPATTPTSALELSNISPPTLASGCVPRATRGASLADDHDLSNISQPQLASGCIRRQARSNDISNISPPGLASGCIRRQPRSQDLSNISPPALASGCLRRRNDLSNISPPALASGCRRNVRNSPSASEIRRRNLKASHCDLSNITQPALASGCYRQSLQNTNRQLRDVTCDRYPTECSFDIENISGPQAMSTAQRCPMISAHRAKTPLRIKPNRPYRPRRICEEE